MWNQESLKCVASINQFKDPDGICSISANSTNIFTGAQTKNIKVWTIQVKPSSNNCSNGSSRRCSLPKDWTPAFLLTLYTPCVFFTLHFQFFEYLFFFVCCKFFNWKMSQLKSSKNLKFFIVFYRKIDLIFKKISSNLDDYLNFLKNSFGNL